MKGNAKMKIRRLINLDEPNGLQNSINRLNKKIEYLKSKRREPNKNDSRQIKYVGFHLKKLKNMASQ